ncbi:gas vesicle protein [Kitasatospora sp. YST-16]|uniref:gas vesicle protein GvpO n=1 Tax=Kitasatospora sp. YST-16 TaxID=2998080 RepID=UPI0022842430|nr:gas vesicle protein GvpO [Kitasatospora sp. YST-16]WAL70028.1 gas vesicle protein [Kitasatospora sp. YST-16]WAL76186.1 gas vesicle protein [Kitasatospora sp. YST-16]
MNRARARRPQTPRPHDPQPVVHRRAAPPHRTRPRSRTTAPPPPRRRRRRPGTRSSPDEDEAPADTGRTRSRSSGSARPARSDQSDRSARAEEAGLGAAEAAGRAAAQVRAMTGRSPEGVTSVERTEDGWRIGVEVVESHRIPDSTDILAVYRVDLDHDGDLLAYRRESRYPRGRFPDQEDPP